MRLTATFLSAALAAALLPITAGAQNLLDDGNFSDASSGSTDSNSDWVLSINMPDGVDRSAQFQTGFANAQNTGVGGPESPGTGAGVWFRSFEGNQGGSGEPLADATLTQTITAPFDGRYLLDFVAGREVNFTADEFSVSLSSSGTGGSTSIDLIAASIPDGNLGGGASMNPGGTPFQLELLGVTAGDMLTVTGTLRGGADSQIPGGQSAFLDSFRLVPEPTSMLLASLAALGLFVRRRS